MQGQLRQEQLSVDIETECAHCHRPLRITLDSELWYSVEENDAQPLVFEPHVDWDTFTEPNIIHAY